MTEHIDKLWPKSPAVRNDPKIMAMEAVEKALRDVWETEKIAGVVMTIAYVDGRVTTATNMSSREEAKRALQLALFLAGGAAIKSVKDLGE